MANLPSLLVTTNYPPHIGGMEEYYAQLARHLDERPVFVSTTKAPAAGGGAAGEGGGAPRGDVAGGGDAADRGVAAAGDDPRVLRLPFRRSSANRFVWVIAWWLTIVPLILRHGIRFLHCGNLTPSGYLGLWTKRLLGIPYSLTFHGMDVERAIRKREKGGPRARTAARILAAADIVFANSRDTRDRLARLGVAPERVRLLPPGVDAERFRPREAGGADGGAGGEASGGADAATDGAARPATLLTVGRYAARKGVADVLRVLPRVAERRDVRFVIAGREQEENLAPLVAELGLEDRVRFAGEVTPDDLPALYRSADLFVMPSREDETTGSVEGFGIVFLEAAASGIPSIGGRSGGMADAIVDGETGYLVTPGDLDEIADRITRLLTDDDLRAQLGRAGRARVLTEFTWAAMGRKAGEEMRRVLAKRPA